eukprot:scaffold2969_cov217-Chaetoceros_neogracile.AAC.3
MGWNYQKQEWLKRFVEKVGKKRSRRLLHTVGVIDHGKIRLMDMSYCPSDRTDGLEIKVSETMRNFDENGNTVKV